MEEQRKELTNVQKKFAVEYLKDPSDGGAAYMRASGSKNKKSCSVQASKLLKLDKLQDYLKEKAQDMLGPVQARILKNVEFWLEVRDGTSEGMNKGNLVSLDEVLGIVETPELRKELLALTKYEVKLARVADRMKASESLAKWMQMFVEKKEISGDIQVIIKDDI